MCRRCSKNPRNLVTRATKFVTVGPNIFSIITEFFFLRTEIHQFISTKQKTPYNSETDRSFQNGGTCFIITLLAPRIWKWLVLYFQKICGPLRFLLYLLSKFHLDPIRGIRNSAFCHKDGIYSEISHNKC